MTTDEQRARYDALLKTAEWRVFAWACKERARHRCEACGADNRHRLQVHHWWYGDGREWLPWVVEPGQVVVWCDDCHAAWHVEWTAFKETVNADWKECGIERGEFFRAIAMNIAPRAGTATVRILNAAMAIGCKTEAGPLATMAGRIINKGKESFAGSKACG